MHSAIRYDILLLARTACFSRFLCPFKVCLAPFLASAGKTSFYPEFISSSGSVFCGRLLYSVDGRTKGETEGGTEASV